MNRNCKNCGGSEGLHHYQTMQCPVGGREAPMGRKQEYMTLTFQPEPDQDEINALKERIALLEEQVQNLLEAVPSADRIR